MEMRSKGRNGFSFLELLVVVALIGILCAIFIPACFRAKARGRSITCSNNLRQMGLGLQSYVHDHQGKYPYYLGPPGPSYGDATALHGPGAGGVYWSSQLVPYDHMPWTNASSHCPGYQGVNAGPAFFDAQGGIERLGSYGYNLMGARRIDASEKFFGLGPAFYWTNAHAVSPSEIKAPTAMISIGESRFVNAAVNQAPGGKDALYCGPGDPYDPARHGPLYNQLFCDGRVAEIDPGQLFNLTNSSLFWNYDHQQHPELWVPAAKSN